MNYSHYEWAVTSVINLRQWYASNRTLPIGPLLEGQILGAEQTLEIETDFTNYIRGFLSISAIWLKINGVDNPVLTEIRAMANKNYHLGANYDTRVRYTDYLKVVIESYLLVG